MISSWIVNQSESHRSISILIWSFLFLPTSCVRSPFSIAAPPPFEPMQHRSCAWRYSFRFTWTWDGAPLHLPSWNSFTQGTSGDLIKVFQLVEKHHTYYNELTGLTPQIVLNKNSPRIQPQNDLNTAYQLRHHAPRIRVSGKKIVSFCHLSKLWVVKRQQKGSDKIIDHIWSYTRCQFFERRHHFDKDPQKMQCTSWWWLFWCVWVQMVHLMSCQTRHQRWPNSQTFS